MICFTDKTRWCCDFDSFLTYVFCLPFCRKGGWRSVSFCTIHAILFLMWDIQLTWWQPSFYFLCTALTSQASASCFLLFAFNPSLIASATSSIVLPLFLLSVFSSPSIVSSATTAPTSQPISSITTSQPVLTDSKRLLRAPKDIPFLTKSAISTKSPPYLPHLRNPSVRFRRHRRHHPLSEFQHSRVDCLHLTFEVRENTKVVRCRESLDANCAKAFRGWCKGHFEAWCWANGWC